MSAAAVIPSLLPLFVAIALRRAEESIHRQLEGARAVSAETAVLFVPQRAFQARRLKALLADGAVRVTADGKHYLDAAGWEQHRNRRSQRIALGVCVALALVGVGLAVALALR
jgi:hypothetical protein